MSKFYYALIVALITCIGCNEYRPNTFAVKGKIINTEYAVVKLITFNSDSNIIVVDSIATQKNGSFELKTHSTTEALYAIKVNNLPYYFIASDVSTVEIEIDAKQYNNYKILNSSSSQGVKEYLQQFQIFETAVSKAKDSIVKAKKNNLSDSLLTILKNQEQTAVNTLKTFCATSINKAQGPSLKYITIYYGFKTNNINNQQAAMYINDAVATYKNSLQLQGLKEIMLQEISINPETLLLNKPVFAFVKTATNGDTINTNNYKGKYVLLDFWASYNKIYRNETAQLFETYKQFKDTNFSIIGISLDTNYKAAIATIKKDSLQWKNCIDTLGIKSELAKKYFIKELPLNVLINPQQKIIAVNLRGNALREKLKALFKR